MNKELIKRIDNWNKIKYPNDNETRIIIATLKPAIDYTIVWKDGTKTFQNEDGTVTTAPNNK
tara:strand:+ start:304 stop:489 length:186 start_codon:yes stop_codon:yes gene_type:complete